MNRVTTTIPPVPRRWRPGGVALKRVLLAGIRRVLAHREAINRINVFPVADGDTGSNLAFTLSAVEQALLPLRLGNAGHLLRRAGDEAIDGARGNSGAILAQFLQGVGERLAGQSRLGLSELAAAVDLGASQARAAVAEPREGTILSVIAAFAAALRSAADSSDGDLRGAWSRAVASSRDALARTPDQLGVLRKAGVVDAGALGFVELLAGIEDYLQRGRIALVQSLAFQSDAGVLAEAAEPDASHRWCTECVLSADDIAREAVLAGLQTLDHSSLVLAGTREKLRVHAHVDEPQQLYELLARYGRVANCKADDMHAQQRATQSKLKVAVVTDSAADLPAAALEQLPLHLVPVRLNFGAQDYLDKVSLSASEFFRELRTNPVLPRTSQPPPGDFRRLFEFLLSHHDEVVYVGLSRAVSGTLQAGESAAQRSAPGRVHIVNSRTASCAQGLLAQKAAELAAQGLDAASIVASIEALVPQTALFAYVRDLSHVVRGGRLPRWTLPLTRWLHLAPIAAVGADGRLHLRSALRLSPDLPQRFAAWVLRRLTPAQRRGRVLVGHCDNRSEAQCVAAMLGAALGLSAVEVVPMGAAISAHAGPGTVLVSLLPEETAA
ncbi:MAG: DegV family EDD domain-containing protein [Rhodanobacteraceae bacterium]|nr:DegV family EDD domain-containing protein [Rhodanobacteraceae bacterium]